MHDRAPAARRDVRTSRTWRWLALLAVLALVAAACGDDDDDDDGADTSAPSSDDTGATGSSGLLAVLQSSGSITVGIANEVPYGYEDESGTVTGEAPEVARAVLAQLGITEMDAVVVEFGALIPGLQADRFDMIAAGMFINPTRAEQILFSDPDYCAATAFAVPAGNPEGLTDFQSIVDTGVTLGVLSGAVEETYALDSGVPDAQVSRFPDTPSVFDGLTAGRVDAVALTDVSIATQVAALDGYEATDGFIPVIDGQEQLGCGGFGFTDQGFRDAFNEILVQMKADDEIFPIIETFGFSQAAVDTARDLTVEDLATGN